MGVSSYFEFFTNHLAWILYENLWDILAASGLIFMPILVMLISNIKESLKGGDDEGSAALQSLKKIQTDGFIMILGIVFCAVPMLDVSLIRAVYLKPALECGTRPKAVKVRAGGAPTGTVHDAALVSIGGQTGKIPLWWAVVHQISKAVSNAAIAGIPCSADIASLTHEMARVDMEPPALRDEIQQFTRDCYNPATRKLHRGPRRGLTAEQYESLRWIGSDYLLRTPGFYDELKAISQVPGWPWVQARDSASGLPERNQAVGGYPYCNDWWSDNTRGLRRKVLDLAESSLTQAEKRKFYGFVDWAAGRGQTTTTEKETIWLKQFLAVQEKKLAVDPETSPFAADYEREGGVATRMQNAVTSIAGVVGAASEAPGEIAENKMIRTAAGLIHPLLVMIVISLMPILLVVGMFQLRTIMTLTIILFGLHFLSYVLGLAYFLDNNMFRITMAGASSEMAMLRVLSNPAQAGLVIFFGKLFYLGMPALFLASFSWVGVSVAGGIAGAMEGASTRAAAVGAAGARAATKAAGAAVTQGRSLMK